jgi:hypothetical protein
MIILILFISLSVVTGTSLSPNNFINYIINIYGHVQH